MIQIRTPMALAAILLSSVASTLPLSGQESGARFFSLGLSAGAGATDANRRGDSWDFGPVFGGRIEWSRGTSAALLRVDVQPFRAARTDRVGDFRAVYLLPTYAVGSPNSRIGLSAGVGVFGLRSETEEETRKVAFVAGVSGSKRITGSLSLDFGWKRVRNVEGLRSNVFMLQLVKGWRL
ncbi:MAG: hypothetical protein PVJ76_04940 [Gemmatimonadota bacterium]